jgi:hypothetical protein
VDAPVEDSATDWFASSAEFLWIGVSSPGTRLPG